VSDTNVAGDARSAVASDTRPATAPAGLDAAERQAWLTFASVLFKLPAALDTQLQRDAGINHFEYVVLAMLSEAPNRMLKMSQLATLASGSQSRLSHVVSRLERRGLVRRAPCPDDRRSIYAVLTDDGYATITGATPGHTATLRSHVLDGLSAEQLTQLRDISGQILTRLDPDYNCPNGSPTSGPQ
jgi:DNA-binding MarR family transcriptional regulator